MSQEDFTFSWATSAAFPTQISLKLWPAFTIILEVIEIFSTKDRYLGSSGCSPYCCRWKKKKSTHPPSLEGAFYANTKKAIPPLHSISHFPYLSFTIRFSRLHNLSLAKNTPGLQMLCDESGILQTASIIHVLNKLIPIRPGVGWGGVKSYGSAGTLSHGHWEACVPSPLSKLYLLLPRPASIENSVRISNISFKMVHNVEFSTQYQIPYFHGIIIEVT